MRQGGHSLKELLLSRQFLVKKVSRILWRLAQTKPGHLIVSQLIAGFTYANEATIENDTVAGAALSKAREAPVCKSIGSAA